MFDEPPAHGMLTAGAVSAALADLRGNVGSVSQDIAFAEPVSPGETLTAVVEVVQGLPDDRLRVRTVARSNNDQAIEGEIVVLSPAHA